MSVESSHPSPKTWRKVQPGKLAPRKSHGIWTNKRMFIATTILMGWLALSTASLIYCWTLKRCDSMTLPSSPYSDPESSPPNIQERPKNSGTETVNRILVVTYVRSGSSFMGDLLSANPSTFYHYEPLHMYTLKLRTQGENCEEAWATMSNLFSCNFEKEPEYLKHSKPMLSFKHNRHLWRICRGILEVGHHPAYVSQICKESKAHIMKLAHMSILQVHQWMSLSEEITKTTKVVHLIRDPRAVWASRRNLGWCKRSFGCANLQVLCRQMREDLDNFASLERNYPGRTVRIRHEEIASDPFKQSRDLYAHLGLNFSEHVSHFLRTHTKAASEDELLNPYSRRRDSIKTVSGWTRKLNMSEVLMVQGFCSDVLIRLGYQLVKSEDQLN